MGGGSGKHTIETRVIYQNSPETVRQLQLQEQKLAELTAEAQKMHDPKLYKKMQQN